MTARGRVQNGVVVLDRGAHFHEGQEVTVLGHGPALAAPSLQGLPLHSVLDIPAVSLGPLLSPWTPDDDLLGEMLDGRS